MGAPSIMRMMMIVLMIIMIVRMRFLVFGWMVPHPFAESRL